MAIHTGNFHTGEANTLTLHRGCQADALESAYHMEHRVVLMLFQRVRMSSVCPAQAPSKVTRRSPFHCCSMASKECLHKCDFCTCAPDMSE